MRLAEAAKLQKAPEGRDDAQVQTELYIEELVAHIDEFDIGCQTDELLDRPPSPLYVPAKTGIDVATQIYEGDVSCCWTTTSLNRFDTVGSPVAITR